MFQGDTFSGIVSFFATSNGTPTSPISSEGSGLMTVLLEKSTRFPESEPLNLPSFPFSLWLRVLRGLPERDRKSTRLNSSHQIISYAVFCLKKKNNNKIQ